MCLNLQSRFLLDSGNGNETREEKSLWWVPITYTTDVEKDFNTTKPKLWLKAEPSTTVENLPKGERSWLLLNVQQTGIISFWEKSSRIIMTISHFSRILQGELRQKELGPADGSFEH